MVYKADITVIGACVIGLAIASRLANGDRGIYILEKNTTFGQETSSRNSEVIHSGIYYLEGTLKAKTCISGNHALYELCDKYNIAHKKLGKLIVATCDEEIPELEVLMNNGKRNGSEGLRMLSQKEAKELEPNIKVVAALHCPSTGIIDSHGLMRYYLATARNAGAQIAYQAEVKGIHRVSDGYEVLIGNTNEDFAFKTRILINCAGLYSDRIAELAGINITESNYRLYYCKGNYFSVGNGKQKYVQRLVYPVPPVKVTGLGIHVTLGLEGRMRLGPDTEYVDSLDYTVDHTKKRLFYESAKTYLPFIEYDDLEPEMAGIRPKLQGPGGDIRDFVIREESDKGLPGFINLIGIESPGLTASPSIAEYVADIVDQCL